MRYGGAISEEAWYRGYLKFFKRDNFEDEDGHQTPDDWDCLRGGFRFDWEATASTLLTFQGDMYTANSDFSNSISSVNPNYDSDANADISGGNLLGRWIRTLSNTDELTL